MKNKLCDEDEDSGGGKRGDDVKLKAFGVELYASGKQVTIIIISLALIGLLYWHDYKSDKWYSLIHESLWVQTLILATPEDARASVLKKAAKEATVPESVRSKIGTP